MNVARVRRRSPNLDLLRSCEKLQDGPARKEEVATAHHRHESGNLRKAQRSGRRWNRESLRIVADDGIDFILQPVNARIEQPCFLDELELALDIAVQAHEKQALI